MHPLSPNSYSVCPVDYHKDRVDSEERVSNVLPRFNSGFHKLGFKRS